MAQAYFSHCPSCSTEYSISYDERIDESYALCNNCGRKWSIIHTQGAIWLLRTNDPQQKKMYTSSWIAHRGDRSFEGIRPYILLEADYSEVGKQKVAEQGLDRFVWKVQRLIECFDRRDRLMKGHSCERIKLAFACARINARKEKEATIEPGLSVRQVAAITNLSEYEASNCTLRLLDEGSISYEVRPQKGSRGTEAVIIGFLGEPLYQMNEYTAEKTIRELVR